MALLNFDRLWAFVTEQFVCDLEGPHGPTHWQRVMEKGLSLAKVTGADEDIVRLFALFHDCKRINEYDDPGHGMRGAEYAKHLNGDLFTLSNTRLDILIYACAYHADGMLSKDLTVGSCWDADRLDLPRIGIIPDPNYMSTEPGKHLATHSDS